jgi:hypothetical protein
VRRLVDVGDQHVPVAGGLHAVLRGRCPEQRPPSALIE